MSVRIGDVMLQSVQNLYTEEVRTLAEQRVPDQQGNIFQDMGREPITLVLEGLMFGESVLPDIEAFRVMQAAGKPVPFAADIVVGTELTDVIIEDVRIRQLAGYQNHYRYVIRLRENLEPPEQTNRLVEEINAGIASDADAFSADSLGAIEAIQNPSNVSALLSDRPGVLSHLNMEELGGAIATNAGNLAGGDFSSIMQSISKLDPAVAMELVQAVRDADSLGDFIQKYADEGLDILGDVTGVDFGGVMDKLRELDPKIAMELVEAIRNPSTLDDFLKKYAAQGLDFVEELTGVDLGVVSTLVTAMMGGVEFVKALQNVSDKAQILGGSIKEFDPLAGIRPLVTQ